MIANMIEIHANATPFDGGVFVASCDKGNAGASDGSGRVNIPSIIVTGGVMDAGLIFSHWNRSVCIMPCVSGGRSRRKS